MSSALSAAGSTTRWRRIRLAVFARDGRVCQVPLADGRICGRAASTIGHIVPRMHGGDDRWSNLRAECAYHNYRVGSLLRARRAAVLDHRARGW